MTVEIVTTSTPVAYTVEKYAWSDRVLGIYLEAEVVNGLATITVIGPEVTSNSVAFPVAYAEHLNALTAAIMAGIPAP